MTAPALAALLWLGCSPDPAPSVIATPDAQAQKVATGEVATKHQRYQLRWRALQPIALGELFSVEAVLLGADGAPVPNGTVKIDARMPQHGHGMATKPVDDPGVCAPDLPTSCVHPEGRYRTDGMKFHMPGDWTITFEVDGPAGPDRAEVVYKL